jgi:CDGSH-type Zn-finger protein
MAINVLVKRNGPYLVTGDLGELQINDADGNKFDLTGKQAVALCRCGASVNKPFCDGTHSKIGFQAAEAAVKAEEQG